MTTLTDPLVITYGTNDDGDWCHLTCCDDNLAMCGLDVTDHEQISDDENVTECPYCAAVRDAHRPCPVTGCTPQGSTN